MFYRHDPFTSKRKQNILELSLCLFSFLSFYYCFQASSLSRTDPLRAQIKFLWGTVREERLSHHFPVSISFSSFISSFLPQKKKNLKICVCIFFLVGYNL